jgi:hypothetical protein
MLNPDPHLEPGIPSWERADAHPHLDTGRAPPQLRIDCSAGGNETQQRPPETGCQFQCSYSNNADNPCLRNNLVIILFIIIVILIIIIILMIHAR